MSVVTVVAYHIDVPEDLVDDLIADEFIAVCLEHNTYEIHSRRTPKEFEDEIERREGRDHPDSPSLQDVTSDELLALDAEASEW